MKVNIRMELENIFEVEAKPQGSFEVDEATLARWEAAKDAYDAVQAEMCLLLDAQEQEREQARAATLQAKQDAYAQKTSNVFDQN
jgi:hypothetical protein